MQEPRSEANQIPERKDSERSEFVKSLQKGLLLGVALLVLIVPPIRMAKNAQAPEQPPVAAAPQPQEVPPSGSPGTSPGRVPVARLADFRGEDASAEARLLANWVTTTHDNRKRGFVVVDKKDARVYVFSPAGTLIDSAPALLGKARGDHSVPGIGEKPLAQIREDEKTTPAGRFIAEPGRNSKNEDIVWVDYDAAVSMHRVRPLVASERRLERLATLTTDDNRVSFGCINLPVSFYEDVLSPTVKKHGAIVYVLPDVKSVQQVFGAFDVTDPIQLAAFGRHRAGGAPGMQKVALQQQPR